MVEGAAIATAAKREKRMTVNSMLLVVQSQTKVDRGRKSDWEWMALVKNDLEEYWKAGGWIGSCVIGECLVYICCQ